MASGLGIIVSKTLGADPERGEPLPIFEPQGFLGFALLGLGLLLMVVVIRLDRQAKAVQEQQPVQPPVRRWPELDGRRFIYRRHLFQIRASMPYVMVLLACVGAFFAWQASSLLAQIGLVIGFFLIILEIGVIYLIYGWMVATQVAIEGDTLIHKNRKGEDRIPMRDIIRLEFPSIPYGGGWLKIVTAKKTIRLTVVFEDIATFCRFLKGRLLRLNHPCFDEAKFYRFQQLAFASDLSWLRVYRYFWRSMAVFLLGDLVLAFVLRFVGWQGLTFYVAFGLGAFIPVALILVLEVGLARRCYAIVERESLAFIPLPRKLEDDTYNKGLAVGFILQLIFIIGLLVSTIL